MGIIMDSLIFVMVVALMVYVTNTLLIIFLSLGGVG